MSTHDEPNSKANTNALIHFAESEKSITFAVRVIPRSSKTEIIGEHDGALKIKLKSPPVNGAANEELIRFLSKLLTVPKTHIKIVSGETSRVKRIRASDITSDQIKTILQAKI